MFAFFFFFQAEGGIRDRNVTGVQTCALPILLVSTDLAAMAPGTTIGSVQPVEVGPGGVVPVTDPKIINAVVTAIYVELALHNRSTDLASRFVIDNLNLDATQAQSLRAP